ncbi:Coq4 family protein [Erythrobacter dokdonensis]|uniref:Coq4 domain-containing protein n=1 Tax=Erythrobacter dokdonensis DSW-74 TaxID=1300349 RepID=A0A1A7BH86_9SPHN|nr:Coq4 family protein [Erythrobacter dokdonensis]OBV11839.1 Coq4 domain-containing protein [Erythrobacter dokdonensis DSW-74]
MALLDLPLVAPDRKMAGFRPFKVLHHFGKLVADKEDTEQVFHIIEATKGRKSHAQAHGFIRSPEGQRFMRDGVDIPAMLDDHARWADCGPDSVAAHYIAFMKREGLSAAGLVAESHKWAPPESLPKDQTQWYFDRLRDTHDLFHVLTGYGRDALGEASLLGFSYEQNHNKGILFIAYAGARQIKKMSGTKAPLFAAIKEGRRLGRAAAKIAHQDIAALMREDIGAARARLGIGKPDVYRQCLAILAGEGILSQELTLGSGQAQAA